MLDTVSPDLDEHPFSVLKILTHVFVHSGQQHGRGEVIRLLLFCYFDGLVIFFSFFLIFLLFLLKPYFLTVNYYYYYSSGFFYSSLGSLSSKF